MNGTKIDFAAWPRAAMFRHYTENVNAMISLTADVDVTALAAWCKANEVRFYPAFMYVVSRAVNAREAFRMGHDKDGDVVLWDEVYPSFTDFHPEDETFIRLIAPYTPDFFEFYRGVTDEMEQHRNKTGFDVSYPYQNTFDVSCLPWLSFTSCGMQVTGKSLYLAPILTWGKHTEKNGRQMMPLNIQIHHSVADGYHIGCFFSDIDGIITELVKLKRETEI